MKKVLFLCVHNSARSQIARAYLDTCGEGRFDTDSAGLEAGKLNPYVVRAMAEDGIDISGRQPQSVFDLQKEGRTFDIVVTVCSPEAAERCPLFPGMSERLHWPFPDHSTFTGTDEEIMTEVRKVREMIKGAVKEFAASH